MRYLKPSQQPLSSECYGYGNIASLPDDHQLFVTSLTTAVILAATHLGTGGKKADCATYHVSAVMRHALPRPAAEKKFCCRAEEKKILDSVMGPAVYDSRIRPSGINGTGIQCPPDSPQQAPAEPDF